MAREPFSIKIVKLSEDNLTDINSSDNHFYTDSKLIPRIEGEKIHYSFEKLSKGQQRFYPDDELDYSTYVDNADRAAFFAYVEGKCAGQVVLRRNWNRYAYVEDIRVSPLFRRAGIGRKLIDAAVNWAKEGGMSGVMLETQDYNGSACRFYESCGFTLGGVDFRLYGATPNCNEVALFWYYIFK